MTSTPSVLTRARNRARRFWRHAHQQARGIPFRLASPDGLPIPPGRLIYTVANSMDLNWFFASGAAAARSIREALERQERPFESLGDVLDFGCGIGRVLRHWPRNAGPTLHGTDFNPRLVAWCARNLPHARIQANPLEGPLAYPNASFDLVYALSVFTHLPQDLQCVWMEELRRVLRPGGLLLVTLHGQAYRDQLTPSDRAAFDRGELVIRRANAAGGNDCAAFHPEPYVRDTFSRAFEIVEHRPEGALGNPIQDQYVFRKPR